MDVGADTVKLLALSERGRRRQVEFHAMAPLPPNAVVDGQFRDVEAIGEAIGRLLSGWRRRPKTAAAAMRAACARSKTFEVDAAFSDEEVEALIAVEAEHHLPCAIEEAAYDFEVQGLSESSPGQAELLLTACRKEHLALRQAALKAAGLRPLVVDTETFALGRALELCCPVWEEAGNGQAVALLDLGSAAKLLVFDRSHCLYEREQPLAAGRPAAAEGRFSGFANAGAKEALRLPGASHNRGQPSALAPAGGGADSNDDQGAVVRQAAQALESFRSAQPYREVHALYLTGGGACVDGLAEALAAALPLPVLAANPFREMSVAARVDAEALSKQAPALMLACGLALRKAR